MAEPNKRTRSADETRGMIVAEAAALFATRGYERTSLDAIARSIGISAPALYYHFDSKDEILFATLENTLVELNQMSQKEVDAVDQTPADKLRAFVRAHVKHDVGSAEIMPMLNAGLYNIDMLIEALPADRRQRLTNLQRTFLDRLRAILRDGVKQGLFEIENVTTTAFAIIGIVDFAVYWFRREGKLSIEDLAEQYGTMALRMAGNK